MEILLKNKRLLGAALLFILAFWLYNFFSSDSKISPVATGLGSASSEPDQSLVKIATELSRITFNQGLFATPGYRLFTDFSINVPPQPVGRPNPFDIIGRD